jgi:signal transduction histidine kinase
LHLAETDWNAPRLGTTEESLHTRAQLRREQQARLVAEASAWRLRRMQALLSALAGAESPRDVGQVLLEQALPLLGAAGGGLHLVLDDTEMLELLHATGYPRDAIAAWHWMPLSAPMPAADAVRSGKPIWIGSIAESLSRYPKHMHQLAPIAARAIVALPLAAGGKAIGALTLSFEEERVFNSVERARAAELLTLVVPALARACRCAPLHAAGPQAIAAARARDEQILAACALVDDIVALTSLQPAVPARTAVDLVALVQRVARQAKADQPADRIVIRADPPSIVGAWVGAELERVFANLLDNALKYSPREMPIEILLRVEVVADGRWAVAEVRDRGLGIPETDLPRVFDGFHRGSNVVGYVPGTGMGLASVRALLEHHGGAVEVASGEGRGSTFTVRLPLADADCA